MKGTLFQLLILLLALLLSLLLNNTFGQKIDGQRWKEHFVNDLLPYWNMQSALGARLETFQPTGVMLAA
jgi:hypothetical protein